MLYVGKKEQEVLSKLSDFKTVIVEPSWDVNKPYLYPGDEPISSMVLSKLIKKGLVKKLGKEFQPIDIEDCTLYRVTKEGAAIISSMRETVST